MNTNRRFSVRYVVITLETLDKVPLHLLHALIDRHYACDWGDTLSNRNKHEMESALLMKKEVTSLFPSDSTNAVVAITTKFESDRTVVTLQ